MNDFGTTLQIGGLLLLMVLFIGSIAGAMTLPQFCGLWITLIASSTVGMALLAFTVAFS